MLCAKPQSGFLPCFESERSHVIDFRPRLGPGLLFRTLVF